LLLLLLLLRRLKLLSVGEVRCGGADEGAERSGYWLLKVLRVGRACKTLLLFGLLELGM